MQKLLLIGLGGATGSVLRYLVQGWVHDRVQNWGSSLFPWGTLVVNVSGCLAMGFLSGALTGSLLVREEYRLAILVGVLGGYTTFSSFALESFNLAGSRQNLLALGNLLLSCGLGFAGVWFGMRLAQRLFGV